MVQTVWQGKQLRYRIRIKVIAEERRRAMKHSERDCKEMDFHCSMCGWKGHGKKLVERESCPKCGSEEVCEIGYHKVKK